MFEHDFVTCIEIIGLTSENLDRVEDRAELAVTSNDGVQTRSIIPIIKESKFI